jgi:4-amino-4-deoxychorismate lyase
MTDTRGAVICGTMTNLFVVHAGAVLTPRLTHCGVAGTVRAAVLGAAADLGLSVSEAMLNRGALHEVEEIFLTNALIGVWPVRRVDNREYAVGPVTRRLQAALEAGGSTMKDNRG